MEKAAFKSAGGSDDDQLKKKHGGLFAGFLGFRGFGVQGLGFRA